MSEPGVRAVMSRRMCEHRLPPGAAHFRGGHPVARANGAGPEAVLGVEPDRQRAHPLLQRLPTPAAHDVHLGIAPLRQGAQQGQQSGVGAGQLGRGGERHQRPVVVEQEQQLVGAVEQLDQLGPERGLARGGRDGAHRRTRDSLELLQERGDPAGARRRSAPGSGAGPAARGARRAPCSRRGRTRRPCRRCRRDSPAPPRAAPRRRRRTRSAPARRRRPRREATNSLATRFIPSRSGVTTMTSAAR